MDNHIRKHWVIYYQQRKSLVSETQLQDEIARLAIPRTFLLHLADMYSFATGNAPKHATHFRIGRAIDKGQRRVQEMITEPVPCR